MTATNLLLSFSHSVVSDSLPSHGLQPARLLCPRTERLWVAFPSPGDLPDLEIEPESPALAGGFFTTEPPGKP